MRTIAITGASGFIGAALTSALRARGDRVRPLVRPGKQAEDGIAWDPEGETIDAQGLEGIDALVHLAGENIAAGRWTEAQKARIRESRLRGTALLARTLVQGKQKPRVWLSASAIGYYGNRGDAALDERAEPGDDFLSELSVAWERATVPAEQAGIRVIHARIGIVLDPSGGALAKMLLPFKLGFGGTIGSGRQVMSWISRTDVVRALIHLLDRDELRGAFNLTAPTPVSNAELTTALGRALHRPTVLPVPAFAARLAFGEMADAALLSGARVLPTRLLESGFHFEHPELGPYLARALARP